jgi:hypothetical protein
MTANARWGDRAHGFLDAESLARRIAARDTASPHGAEGGSVDAQDSTLV